MKTLQTGSCKGEGKKTVDTTVDVPEGTAPSVAASLSKLPGWKSKDNDRRRTVIEEGWGAGEILFTGYNRETTIAYAVVQKTPDESRVTNRHDRDWGIGGLDWFLSDDSPMKFSVPEPLDKGSISELIKSQDLTPVWWAFRINS